MRRFLTITALIAGIALGQVPLTTAQIAKRVAPSVVTIQGKTDSGDVLGSGFIVSKDGKIATNLHVIRDMKTARVQLASGEAFDSVSVLATDDRRDLAVVQIAGFDLAPVELGNSGTLAVGEPVVIVGSPRGLEGTVTAGILSSIRDSGDGFTVLQTDAAVNPGNSGGPMVNGKGQVIGVVSFKLLSSEGLNFAVPINYVKGLLSQLHTPMSLDEMRKSLEADQQTAGPSLKETLDWLKEKLPLASTYSTTQQPYYTQRTIPIRFESCTVVFEDSLVYPDLIDTDRWTVPLGEVTRVEVEKPAVVRLYAISQGILKETRSRSISTVPTGTDIILNLSLGSASLVFHDESIAQRVADAFKHAADLCRGKEPF